MESGTKGISAKLPCDGDAPGTRKALVKVLDSADVEGNNIVGNEAVVRSTAVGNADVKRSALVARSAVVTRSATVVVSASVGKMLL